jgi:hypothetical protein
MFFLIHRGNVQQNKGIRAPARAVSRFVALTIGVFASLAILPAPLPLPTAGLRFLDAQDMPHRMQRPPDSGSRVAPPLNPPQSQPAPTSAPAAPTAAPVALQPAAAPTASVPDSLLSQPAEPAHIEFSPDSLSIRADNSSLGAILREVASKSGMDLEGFGADERVFGTFGPGRPEAVLSDLLDGTPYDLLMVGALANGAPRQLLLTPSTPGGSAPPPPQNNPLANDNDNAEDQPAQSPPPQPGQRREFVPGPGSQQQIKSPQQMLQELEAMRQRQQQTQQGQQGQPGQQQGQQPPQQ